MIGFAGSNLDFLNFMSEDKYNLKEVYGDSKLANILFTRQLATILKGEVSLSYAFIEEKNI